MREYTEGGGGKNERKKEKWDKVEKRIEKFSYSHIICKSEWNRLNDCCF